MVDESASIIAEIGNSLNLESQEALGTGMMNQAVPATTTASNESGDTQANNVSTEASDMAFEVPDVIPQPLQVNEQEAPPEV